MENILGLTTSFPNALEVTGDMSLTQAVGMDISKLLDWLRMQEGPGINWDAWAAIGGVCSALVAVAAFVFTAVSYMMQRKREFKFKLEEQQDRRRAQAIRLLVWYENRMIHIENKSDLPVFDVYAFLVNGTPGSDAHVGDAYKDVLKPNGLLRTGFPSGPPNWNADLNRFLIVIFKDSNNVAWERTGRGTLREIPHSVWDHYGVNRSMTYFVPSHAE